MIYQEVTMYLLIIALFTPSDEFVSQRTVAQVVDEQMCKAIGNATAANLSFQMRPMVVKFKCVTGDMT